MDDNELVSGLNSDLELKCIKIDDIVKVDDYLFMMLSNGQNILTNGKNLYEVTEYDCLTSLFSIGDKFCAVFTKGLSLCAVDLKTMEVLFEDKNACHISKQDDRTLRVTMKFGRGNNTIYDIETSSYLPAPEDYEFEHSLGNNLYVFREKNNSNRNFYDYKRCVINANGKILMKNIEGWIDLNCNYIIITKKDEICIVEIADELMLEMKTIKQNKEILAKPDYHDGNIIVMAKDGIKVYTPALQLVKEIMIEELSEIIDYQIVSDTLRLCSPYTINEKQINRYLFINLVTGKSISHIRIDGYPYWMPTTYVGCDSIDTEITNYYFYNKNFDSIIRINASSYEVVDTDRECMFVIRAMENGIEKTLLLNTQNGSIKEVSYDFINFPVNQQYGYGIDFTKEKMDFFDENLEIIISDFDYKKYELDVYDFGYFIVNDYICIIKHFIDGYGMSRDRTIIQNQNGDVVLDSMDHSCFALGSFIQIIHNKESEFLNTLTGDIGKLSISEKVDENGKIDLNEMGNINNFLTVSDSTQLYLPLLDDNEDKKIKKLIPKIKKDD